MKLRITVEGKIYDVEVEVLEDSSPAERPAPSEFHIPESVLRSAPPSDLRPEDKICRSPIAGVITAVSAVVGQSVKKDDPLVAIEAMKMETSVGAPLDGLIKAVNVGPGENVKAGQVLLELS